MGLIPPPPPHLTQGTSTPDTQASAGGSIGHEPSPAVVTQPPLVTSANRYALLVKLRIVTNPVTQALVGAGFQSDYEAEINCKTTRETFIASIRDQHLKQAVIHRVKLLPEHSRKILTFRNFVQDQLLVAYQTCQQFSQQGQEKSNQTNQATTGTPDPTKSENRRNARKFNSTSQPSDKQNDKSSGGDASKSGRRQWPPPETTIQQDIALCNTKGQGRGTCPACRKNNAYTIWYCWWNERNPIPEAKAWRNGGVETPPVSSTACVCTESKPGQPISLPTRPCNLASTQYAPPHPFAEWPGQRKSWSRSGPCCRVGSLHTTRFARHRKSVSDEVILGHVKQPQMNFKHGTRVATKTKALTLTWQLWR
jgi:hypothetical protein